MKKEAEDNKIEAIARAAAKAAAQAAVDSATVSHANQEIMLNKIDVLAAAVHDLDNCFDRFKLGIGSRLEGVEHNIGKPKNSLDVLESKMETIMWLLRGVASPILISLVLSVIGYLVVRLMSTPLPKGP